MNYVKENKISIKWRTITKKYQHQRAKGSWYVQQLKNINAMP